MSLPARIFLVGLPGAGKSTVGKYIAAELGYTFIDLDERIETIAGQTIHDIFEQEGEERFREYERDALRAITDEKVVVATGGGAPCFHGNMDWMNAYGLTVFLNPPLDIILARIAHETHRPLLKGDSKEKMEELMEKREKFYKKSRMESGRIEPCEILAELLHFLNV
jgi:shikimate kinase